MKQRYILTVFLFLTTLFFTAIAQVENPQVYNPNADARADIEQAKIAAKNSGKNVFIMMGGNWCPWCLKYHAFIHENRALDSLYNADFEFVLVNYDRKKKDMKLLEDLGFPQRFGFPVFIILNSAGEMVHIQNSAYLELGKGYDPKLVANFLQNWSPAALDRNRYINPKK